MSRPTSAEDQNIRFLPQVSQSHADSSVVVRIVSCVSTNDGCRRHGVVGEHPDQQGIYVVDPGTRLISGAIKASIAKQLDNPGAHRKVRKELVVIVLPGMDSPNRILPRIGIHCNLDLVVGRRPVSALGSRQLNAALGHQDHIYITTNHHDNVLYSMP